MSSQGKNESSKDSEGDNGPPKIIGDAFNVTESKETEASQPRKVITYIHGPRLYVLSLALWIMVFLVNMEISIVSTSLVTITNDFHSFSQSSWVVSAYQITYSCLLVIWAKLSDIFGRKSIYLVSVLIFVAFSGACGAAQTMIQLIIFRAFQGIGAAGVFSISTVVIYEIIPKEKLPIYAGITFAFVAAATVTGPLLGGAIDTRTTWRWIFLLNVPVGVCTGALMLLVMPANFPYHESTPSSSSQSSEGFRHRISRMDFIGVILMLAASILLVTGLLEAITSFQWSSPTIIVLLTLAGLLWLSFFVWEWYLSTRLSTKQEALFPARFFQNRVWMGTLVVSFAVGVPMTVLGIDLPQRFQAVNSNSPLQAGIHLLAFSVAVPMGSFFGNIISAAIKAPVILFVLIASVLELVGIILLSTISSSQRLQHAIYGYEIMAGFGSGALFSILALMVPRCVDAQDIALAAGTFIQFRMMGSAIGIAVAGSVINSYLTTHLASILSETQLSQLLQNISELNSLDPATGKVVEHTFGQAYNVIFKIVIGLAVLQVVCVALIWKKPLLVLKGAGH